MGKEGDMYTGGIVPRAALGEVSLAMNGEYSDG
jgi:hypothetical protein